MREYSTWLQQKYAPPKQVMISSISQDGEKRLYHRICMRKTAPTFLKEKDVPAISKGTSLIGLIY